MADVRTTWWGKVEYPDDRGRLRALVSDSALYKQVRGRPPRHTWLVTIFVASFFLASAFSSFLPASWIGLQAVSVKLAFLVCFAGSILAWRYRSNRVGTIRPLSAYLLAHRICGACGYRLHSSPVQSDGCAVCPECGAAWHHDRFVWMTKLPRPGLPYLPNNAMGIGPLWARLRDDRGVPLSSRYRWPPAWIDARSEGDEVRGEVDRLRSSKLKWYVSVSLPVGITIVLGLWGMYLLTFDGWRTDDLLDVALICLPIVGFVALVIWRIVREEALQRWVIDTAARCYNCGDPLPTNSATAFDGCFACVTCGHAWKPSRNVMVR